MFWNQFFKVAVEFFIWHTLQMNIFLTNNALKRCLCHKRLWMLSWLASCIISKCHSKHCCWSWTIYIQEGWWSWLLRITHHFFFRISLKHDKSAFVAYLFYIQIWRKRFLICQAHLCHIWSIIDAQQNFSISKQSQITRILLLLLLLSPFSILFSFLLGSIFSRFYFPFIWYFQLIGGFKVRHFTNAFPSKRSKIVEHVLLHPISQFTKTSLFSWKMRATLLKLDDKYKLAKKTLQKQLSVTSMPAATGLWRLTGQLPGTFKKSHTFL